MATEKNVYQMVTDRIISELEIGVIPWEKPWSGVRTGAFNRISKKPYSLLNQMLLRHSGEYATFKQWNDIGGKIRRGEKAEIVTFWKAMPIEEADENGEKIIGGVPVLRYYNVFHISQVDGVEPLPDEELKDTKPIEEAENLLHEYISREGIKLEYTRSDEAYYSPSFDTIHLPLLEQFELPEEAYSTYFHEAIHSTGYKTRLNRFDENTAIAAFGSETYSKEELVAEIGSAMICNMLRIESKHSFRNNVAYIQSWLKVLKNDNRFVVSASSRAEKAVSYIVGIEA